MRPPAIDPSTEDAAGPVGYLLVGYAAQQFGVKSTFVGIALAIVVIAVAGVLALDDLATGPLPWVAQPPTVDR